MLFEAFADFNFWLIKTLVVFYTWRVLQDMFFKIDVLIKVYKYREPTECTQTQKK